MCSSDLERKAGREGNTDGERERRQPGASLRREEGGERDLCGFWLLQRSCVVVGQGQGSAASEVADGKGVHSRFWKNISFAVVWDRATLPRAYPEESGSDGIWEGRLRGEGGPGPAFQNSGACMSERGPCQSSSLGGSSGNLPLPLIRPPYPPPPP